MGKDPAVLFYTGDFMSGTAFMNYEQKGRYISLLCMQHQCGRIPESTIKEVSNNDQMILCKFEKDENGFYYNERMELESVKRKLYSDSRKKAAQSMHMHKHMQVHMQMHMGNRNRNEDGIGIGIKEGDARGGFKRPALEEIKAYIAEKGYGVDPEKFYNYYESNGWRVGKNPMKNWKAAVNTWTRNDSQQMQLTFKRKFGREEVSNAFLETQAKEFLNGEK